MNDAETIASLATKAASAQIVPTPDGRMFLVVPEGFGEREISDPNGLIATKPLYVKGKATLQTKDSLVDYVKRYAGAETVLFADIGQNRITAVIDYHVPIAGGGVHAERAAHRAELTLFHSEEWNLWKGVSNVLKPQLEFARFVEENAADVTAPSGAELLEAARDLQAHRKVNFTKAVRTSSDNENFEYTDETEAKTRGGLELPSRFQLGLSVYFGEPITEVYAFLRWKLEEGALLLGVKLHRVEHIRQAVFKQIVVDVGERTGCPVVFGTPA